MMAMDGLLLVSAWRGNPIPMKSDCGDRVLQLAGHSAFPGALRRIRSGLFDAPGCG
jgi:hypothetical protein